MSDSFDYFFKSHKSFETLCREMCEYLDFVFEPSREGENHVYVRFLGIGIDFYIHDFENDGEPKFKDYKYFIGLTARPYSKHLRLSVLASITNILYFQMDVSEGILIYNLGRLLAKYREEIDSEGYKNMYDEVSGKFVEFPQHLVDLENAVYKAN